MFLSKDSYFDRLYQSFEASMQTIFANQNHIDIVPDFVGTPSGKSDPLVDIDFLSPKIQSYIYKHFPVLYRYSLGKTVLYVGAGGAGGLPAGVHREALAMFQTILVLQNLFDKEGRIQTVYYYPTPFKKSFRRGAVALGPNEVNSGVTFLEPPHNHKKKNGLIILFRREEAMKVLIHELIHSFHLDFQIIHHSMDLKRDICSNYPVLLNEAFTEAFATLLHLYFICKGKNRSQSGSNKTLLRKAFQQELNYEFALCRRILHENGMEVGDLPKLVGGGGKECLAHFQQQTNVFSYYILKPCILQDIMHFDRFMKQYSKQGEVMREGVQILENHLFHSLRHPQSDFAKRLHKTPMYKGNSLKMVFGKIM